MKRILKIAGVAVIFLTVFVLAAFWVSTSEVDGEFYTRVAVSPIVISLLLVLGLYLGGVWKKYGDALSLLPAALLGMVLSICSNTPLWGEVRSGSWFRLTPLALLLTAFFTVEVIVGLVKRRATKFNVRTCLAALTMLVCASLPVAAYGIREAIYAGMSTSAGSHAGMVLLSNVLTEVFCIVGGLAVIPFVSRKGDRLVGGALAAMGGIGIVLHAVVFWGGQYGLLGRLTAAVREPLGLTVFAALAAVGICLMLRKESELYNDND